MALTVIRRILALLFGEKYYVNIVNWRGTEKFQPTEFIWTSRQQAKAHREMIESTASFAFIETITFRSRMKYHD